MKRLVAVLLMSALLAAGLAFAERKDRTLTRTRAPFRSVTSAVSEQQVYDTLNVTAGQRLVVTGVNVFADDSAQTPTLRVRFMSSVTRAQYLQLGKTFAANEVSYTTWAPNYAFPADSSIVVQWYIVGGAINTLDTLAASVTYQIENTQ